MGFSPVRAFALSPRAKDRSDRTGFSPPSSAAHLRRPAGWHRSRLDRGRQSAARARRLTLLRVCWPRVGAEWCPPMARAQAGLACVWGHAARHRQLGGVGGGLRRVGAATQTRGAARDRPVVPDTVAEPRPGRATSVARPVFRASPCGHWSVGADDRRRYRRIASRCHDTTRRSDLSGRDDEHDCIRRAFRR